MHRSDRLRPRRYRGGTGAVLLALVIVGCSAEPDHYLDDLAVGSNDLGVSGDLSAAAGVPCAVSSLLQAHCLSCHGQPPQGAPLPLVTYQDLTTMSPTLPGQKVAERALLRMQDTKAPMPPGPMPTVPAGELAAFQAWVSAGTPAQSCQGAGADLGISGDLGSKGDLGPSTDLATAGDMGMDPLNAKPQCSSGKNWTNGEQRSPNMHPGRACITCHSMGKGPSLRIAGTVYPSGHEPDDCLGAPPLTGVNVEITDATGKVVNLTLNASGNFLYSATMGTIALPYHAKVKKAGRERAMVAAQMNGDCNSCHTQSGAGGAPGRITLPF